MRAAGHEPYLIHDSIQIPIVTVIVHEVGDFYAKIITPQPAKGRRPALPPIAVIRKPTLLTP
jgi:hypothetical protein